MKLVARIKMSELAKIYGKLDDGFIYELSEKEIKMNSAAMKYFISCMEFNEYFFYGRFDTTKERIDELVNIDKENYGASFFCDNIEAGYWHFKYLKLAYLMQRINNLANDFCKSIAENDYAGIVSGYEEIVDSKIIYYKTDNENIYKEEKK